MKYLYILFLLLAQTAFSQVPIPDFPCYRQFYKSTNEYGLDFYADDWRKAVTDSMDLYSMKKGISTVEGKVILLPIYDDIVILNDLKDSCLIEIPYAIVTLNEKQYVVNLETGAKTKSHNFILYDDHQFFYRDLKIWGVYDLDFKLLVKDLPGISGTNGDPSDLEVCDICTSGGYAYTNSFTLEFKNKLKAKGIEIDFPKVVLYTISDEPTTEKELLKLEKWQKKHPTEPWYKEKLGLVDLSTGKKITPRFDKVDAKLLNDQIYYWCYKYSWKYPFPESHSLVIYDKHLKEVYQYENDFLPRSNLETGIPNPSENNELYSQLREFEPRQNVYLIKDKTGKLGAINASGKLVVPFVYDSVSYLGESEKYLYKIWTNGQFRLLTNEGTELKDAKEAMRVLDASNQAQYYIRTDSTSNFWYLLDPATNQKTGPFDTIYPIGGMGMFDQFLKFDAWNLGHGTYLVRQGNNLLYSQNNQFQVLDSSAYSFKNETVLIQNMIIAKSGEIIHDGFAFNDLNDSSYVEYSEEYVPIRIYHVDGVRTLELKDVKYVQAVKYKPEIWVVLKNKKSRYFNTETWKWKDE